jgi:hypothetical protein
MLRVDEALYGNEPGDGVVVEVELDGLAPFAVGHSGVFFLGRPFTATDGWSPVLRVATW